MSFDENRVMLYDFDMPLFNKEYSREEFDRKVRENPMNDHLKVSDLPAEEKDEISETEVINDTKTEQSANPETDYEDAFFIDRDSESVTWMYYNPDSTAGGQYVTNVLSFSDIQQAAQENKSADEFFDYLGSIARQELADVGTEWFADVERRFKDAPTLTNCTPETMDSLVSVADTEQRKSIATRLVDIVKDTDFYEYQDSLEVGETDEEAIENIQSHLSDDTYVEIIRNDKNNFKIKNSIKKIKCNISIDKTGGESICSYCGVDISSNDYQSVAAWKNKYRTVQKNVEKILSYYKKTGYIDYYSADNTGSVVGSIYNPFEL